MVKLSVIMPVYNALPFLKEAVESVLAQTYSDFEFLIFDDASTDGSGAYLDGIDDSRVRVLHCPKQGYAALLNQGVMLAGGEFVARMDADDMAMPDRLEKQLDELRRRPSVAVCGCQAIEIDEEGKATGAMSFPTCDAEVVFALMTGCALPHPGVMYRRDAVLAAGGYDPEMVPAEDYDLWTRLAVSEKLVNHRDALILYRRHSSNVSLQQDGKRKSNTMAVACRFVVALGLAESAEEASAVVALKRKMFPAVLGSLTVAEGCSYCEFVSRFERAYEKIRPDFAQQIGSVRREVRWQFLTRAAMCGPFSRERWEWVRLAMRVDPREMCVDRVLARLSRRLFQRTERREVA